MARKSLPIFDHDGTLKYHTTYPDAFSLVKSEVAVWETPYKSVRLLDRRVVARGVGQFRDVWKLIPSGGPDGIPVWQVMTSGAEA